MHATYSLSRSMSSLGWIYNEWQVTRVHDPGVLTHVDPPAVLKNLKQVPDNII